MGLNVCPAAIVAAPVNMVWDLLADPLRYSEWADGKVERVVPEGLVSVGQIFYITSKAFGHTWSVRMSVEKVSEQIWPYPETDLRNNENLIPLHMPADTEIPTATAPNASSKFSLDIHVIFPLGLQLRQHTSCTPIDASSCRVQYG